MSPLATLAQSQPVGHDAAEGVTHNAVIIANASSSPVDLDTTGYQWLHMLVRMNTATLTDLALQCLPFEPDGTTPFLLDLAPVAAPAGTVVNNVSYLQRRYQLHGVDKLRVVVYNTSAGALTASAFYFLQK